MKSWMFFLWLLLLAGCASGPSGSGSAGVATGRQESLSAKVHTELAAGYYARAQYAVALDEVNKAQLADAAYAPAFNILGLIRAELREDKQAEAAFRQALALHENYSEAENNFGWYLCQRGRHDEALTRFDLALKNPLYATPEVALANAGICSLAKGNVGEAEAFFFRALKRVPDLRVALLGMADIEFRQGRALAARNKLNQLGDISTLGAPALWLGVRVARVLGMREDEMSYSAQLRRRFPDALQTQWLFLGQYDQIGGLL